MPDTETAPEAVEERQTVTAMGETFTLNSDISEVALMEFAVASDDGEDGDTMKGLASVWRFVNACIADDDRGRFVALARRKNAKAADLMPVIHAVFGLTTERPTARPSDSSDGPTDTGQSSEPNSDVKVSGRFDGRPDLRRHLEMARDAQAS